MLGWTFPIEGAGRRQRRARLRVIIGGIMGNGQATIVYLKWLLAVSMLSSSFLHQIVLVKVLVGYNTGFGLHVEKFNNIVHMMIFRGMMNCDIHSSSSDLI